LLYHVKIIIAWDKILHWSQIIFWVNIHYILKDFFFCKVEVNALGTMSQGRYSFLLFWSQLCIKPYVEVVTISSINILYKRHFLRLRNKKACFSTYLLRMNHKSDHKVLGRSLLFSYTASSFSLSNWKKHFDINI